MEEDWWSERNAEQPTRYKTKAWRTVMSREVSKADLEMAVSQSVRQAFTNLDLSTLRIA